MLSDSGTFCKYLYASISHHPLITPSPPLLTHLLITSSPHTLTHPLITLSPPPLTHSLITPSPPSLTHPLITPSPPPLTHLLITPSLQTLAHSSLIILQYTSTSTPHLSHHPHLSLITLSPAPLTHPLITPSPPPSPIPLMKLCAGPSFATLFVVSYATSR